jgi:hypothetical protein
LNATLKCDRNRLVRSIPIIVIVETILREISTSLIPVAVPFALGNNEIPFKRSPMQAISQ